MKPETFGEWLLIDKLSKRSMTEVYRAVKLGDRSGRSFVVKRVPLGEPAAGAIAESLRRETAVLRSEGLVGCPRYVESSDLGGLPYLVLEYVEGTSLDRLLSVGPLAHDIALGLGRELGLVLAKLHEVGFVHGDISPENVLVDELGEVTLIDFGLAYKLGASRDGPGGKPGYTSAEAALGKPATAADDVMAWGIIVAEAILGRHLFHETDLAEAATRAESLPAELEAHPLLARALARDPAVRPTARELCDTAETVDRSVLGELVSALHRNPEAPRVVRSAPVSRTVAQLLKPVAIAAPPIDARTLIEQTNNVAPAKPGFNKATIAALSLGLVFALGLGLVIGRRMQVRNAKASITFPMLPARTEVELDGAVLLVPEPGRAIPIEPGKHRVTIQIGRREATDYEFMAAPGDHIVVVSVNPAKAGLAESAEKEPERPRGKVRKNQ
jgi:serine/threonine-protein kinase